MVFWGTSCQRLFKEALSYTNPAELDGKFWALCCGENDRAGLAPGGFEVARTGCRPEKLG